MMSGDIYRGGGRTAKNLTLSKKDLEGKEPGLSVTTTPTKGWKLPGIKKLEELGFEVVPDPTEDDPNHHVIRPGKKLIDQGHTLREWIDGRDGIDEGWKYVPGTQGPGTQGPWLFAEENLAGCLYSEGTGKPGRNHNPYGFSMWLAGAGVQGGIAYGATDEFGFAAVENRAHVHDLHATILHLTGIDHTLLTYFHQGRNERLTDVYGNVIQGILA